MSQTNIIKGIYNSCYKSWIPHNLCVSFEYKKNNDVDSFIEIQKFIHEVLFVEMKNFFLQNPNELNCDTYIVYVNSCCFQTSDSVKSMPFRIQETIEINNQKVLFIAQTENWIHAQNFTATYFEIIKKKSK